MQLCLAVRTCEQLCGHTHVDIHVDYACKNRFFNDCLASRRVERHWHVSLQRLPCCCRRPTSVPRLSGSASLSPSQIAPFLLLFHLKFGAFLDFENIGFLWVKIAGKFFFGHLHAVGTVQMNIYPGVHGSVWGKNGTFFSNISPPQKKNLILKKETGTDSDTVVTKNKEPDEHASDAHI